MMSLIRSLYLTNRFFLILGLLAGMFVLSFIFPWLLVVSRVLLMLFVLLVLFDALSLYRWRLGLQGQRKCANRFSNGDDNPVHLQISSFYGIDLDCEILDEIPYQFQKRDLSFQVSLEAGATSTLTYYLHPVKRGVYHFGCINVLITSKILGLVSRRYRLGDEIEVKVYPSFIQMHQYELMAFAPNRSEYGMKKIRRLGHNMEFEHIKNYVPGDDFRAINWKATARKNHLMVNSYQDEKSQQVFAVIDKGRTMKMPFEGMSLMDYAINASLVISNIAIRKDDKAGIITFQHKLGSLLPASRRKLQMKLILENLYNQKTNYKESNYHHLYSFIKRKITHRSLLLLFTNFESVTGMRRQLVNLKAMARNHVLVVIFFQNTELYEVLNQPAGKVVDIYTQTIARKLAFEKKLIARELNAHGIYTVLTTPAALTVNTINKYLEIKSRGVI